MKNKTIFHILNFFLLAYNTLFAVQAWNELPEKIPIHFDINGIPNRWTSKGGELIILFIMPWIMTAIMYFSASLLIPWARKHPRWLNMPNKEKFLALPEETQSILFDLLSETFVAIAVGINLVFLAANYGTIQVALGLATTLPVQTLYAAMLFNFAIAIFYLICTFQVSHRLTKQE